ncbi:MAG: carboxymuconolactone decarboxylase family protein [Candidatus Helarchaeota archaeon]
MKNIRRKFTDEDLKEIDSILMKFYGEIPYIYKHLPKKQKAPFFIKNDSLFRSPDSKLSVREKELIAISAATALKCQYCQEVHIKNAMRLGLSIDEIKEAILLSSVIAESSSLAIALRTVEKIEKSHD